MLLGLENLQKQIDDSALLVELGALSADAGYGSDSDASGRVDVEHVEPVEGSRDWVSSVADQKAKEAAVLKMWAQVPSFAQGNDPSGPEVFVEDLEEDKQQSPDMEVEAAASLVVDAAQDPSGRGGPRPGSR